MRVSRGDFTHLTADLLHRGHQVRFQALGYSMQPEILHGDIVIIEPIVHPVADRDIVLYLSQGGRPILHRIVKSKIGPTGQTLYLLRGDAHKDADGWLVAEHILGRMVTVERRGQFERKSPLGKVVRIARQIKRCLRVRKSI